MDNKIQTYVYILYVGTGACLTLGKRITIKKSNMKSPAMLPPRKEPITNQYINRLITEKDQSLTQHLETFPLGFESLINEAHDHNST